MKYLPKLSERLREEAAKTAEVARRLVDRAKPQAEQAASAIRDVASAAGTYAKRALAPEDPTRVLGGNPAFQALPQDLPSPGVLSASVRSDLLLGLSAVGVLSLEDHIVGVTRELFHDGLRHQDLSARLMGADFDAIHGWMDTVPGSAIRGGGILHRLQHGHNVGAAAEIYERHGVTGVLVWAQHLAQDAMTPTGIPIPVGGNRLAGHLVERGIATPGHAALMLSFNIAELAASFLAGAFALRLAAIVCDLQKKREVQRLCTRAGDAWGVGDLDGAIATYRTALALSNGDPAIYLALGWAYAEIGRPAAESFLAFRSAAEGLARTDATTDVGGLEVDLRGAAYLLTLSQAREVLNRENLRGAWQDELDRMLRGALHAFRRTARTWEERPAVSFRGRSYEWRPRPLSAAANYYLAARTAYAAPFLPTSAEAPELADRALSALGRATSVYPDEAGRIARVRDRWALELAPVAVRPL